MGRSVEELLQILQQIEYFTEETEKKHRFVRYTGHNITAAELRRIPVRALYDLGFRRWERGSNLLLFPLSKLRYLDPRMSCVTIFGKVKSLRDIGKDTRFGVIAGGIAHGR